MLDKLAITGEATEPDAVYLIPLVLCGFIPNESHTAVQLARSYTHRHFGCGVCGS